MSWTAPIQLVVVIIILCVQLGATALTGVAFLLVMTPLQGLAMKRLLMLRRKTMIWTDQRVKLIQELLGGMRVIKFFAWEVPYLNKIHELRRKELQKIRSLLIIRSLTSAVAMALPTLATVVAFFAYAYTGGDSRDPATIFTSLTLFNLLRMPLMMLPVALATATDAKNAFSRLKEVFVADQLDITYTVDKTIEPALIIKDGTFMWEGEPPEELKGKGSKKDQKIAKKKAAQEMRASSKERKQQQAMHEKGPEKESRTKQLWKRNGNLAQKDQASQDVQEKDATTMGTGTDMAVPVSEDVDNEEHENHDSHRSSMQFTQDPQVKDVNIIIPRGQLCAIVGPVGAGKSSLLSAMIGEMKRLSGTVVFGGTVGYCAQQAWIQNATL
jgi:ABC-type multidrug transport system fused ATPase/permease subunit